MTLHKKEVLASENYCIKTDITNDKQIALLTSDNVAKIEAILSLDSNYKNSSNPNQKPITKKNSNEYKYIGSTRYWVEELKKLDKNDELIETPDGNNYEKIIEYLIIAIDKENSTHLNSDNIGRNAVKEFIISEYSSPSLLIRALRNIDGDYTLLNEISIPRKEGEKMHFSFATKFCHYCSIFLFEGTDDEDKYSIYDNVLKNALPLYARHYLNESIKIKEYENNYKRYIDLIDKIRNAAEIKHRVKISRTGFDHLVWYFHKGK